LSKSLEDAPGTGLLGFRTSPAAYDESVDRIGGEQQKSLRPHESQPGISGIVEKKTEAFFSGSHARG
jgi:hypothetical protein